MARSQLHLPAVPIRRDNADQAQTRQSIFQWFARSIEAEHKVAQGYDSIYMVLAKKGASL